MTDEKTPFGYTILGGTTICSAFWSYALHDMLYVGTMAFMLFQACLACWAFIGLRKLIKRIRQAFTFAEYDLANFAKGKSPIAHGPDGKFYNAKQAAMNAQLAAENAARKAALEHAVGMK